MKHLGMIASLFLSAALFAACAASDDVETPPDRHTGPYTTTGLALTADMLADTDISSMEFEVSQVDCSTGSALGSVDTRTIDYEDMYLPGGISTFEDKPYDADSRHMFADSYFLVDAGCYDVRTRPLQSATVASADCKPAHKTGVEVADGLTTEILLVNQCRGAERGGLDVIGSINHPPEIDDLVFHDSKFVAACEPQTSICLTASDPDDDPLEFEFADLGLGGIVADGAPTYDAQTGQWTACALIETDAEGTYEFQATVFDLDGNGVRIEDLLALQDPRDAHESRDALTFPIHAGVACGGDDPDVEEPGGEEPVLGCTRTRGYWTTHNEFGDTEALRLDWPQTEDENTLICGQTWLATIGASTVGNVWNQLAAQFIAARLNVAAGASVSTTIDDALGDAESLLTSNCTQIPQSDQTYAETLKDALDDYNNGHTGPGHC